MPAAPREKSIDERVVGSYQIRSRAVRRAFLLGFDEETNQEYPHRKQLLLRRLELLASVFAIDCLDVTVLDSSFDLILRNRPDVVMSWSDREVVERWLRLNRRQIELNAEPLWEEITLELEDEARVREYRRRLSSISWYMAYLKEPLARRFNAEDGVDGHFWAERFDCDRLGSDATLLACSVYVAASPVLAGEAADAEREGCSSLAARVADEREEEGTQKGKQKGERGLVADRLQTVESTRDESGSNVTRAETERQRSGWLAPLAVSGDGYDGVSAQRRPSNDGFLRLSLADYRGVVGWFLERELAESEGRRVASSVPEALAKMGISRVEWELALRLVRSRFRKTWERAARVRAEARRRAGDS